LETSFGEKHVEIVLSIFFKYIYVTMATTLERTVKKARQKKITEKIDSNSNHKLISMSLVVMAT